MQMELRDELVVSERTMTGQPSGNAPLPNTSAAQSTYRVVNDVTLHVVAAGDPADPLVVLLHGFPEFWYEWRNYVEPFVGAGYRVVVPDQRGYNLSDTPGGVRPYRIRELSGDVVALVASEGCETAHVVGHNWGGAVGWDLALRHPEVIDRLAIINVPHPIVFEQILLSSPRQLRKGWYLFFFQLPGLPEWYARRDEYDTLVTAMDGGSRSGTFTETDFVRYRRAWAEDGALTAMINWYRARAWYYDEPPRNQVQAPTLILWGENDQSLVPEMAPKSLDYCDVGSLEQFSEATHWLPHEHPDRVSSLLLEHLGS